MRFHSNTINCVEKMFDWLFCTAILLRIMTEMFSLQVSLLFSLSLLCAPIVLYVAIYLYLEYYSLPDKNEKLLLGLNTFQNHVDAVKAIYQLHYITTHLHTREAKLWMGGYTKMHTKLCSLGNSCGLCYYYYYIASQVENKKNKPIGLDDTGYKILNVFKKYLLRNLIKAFPQSVELKLAYLALANRKEHKDKSFIKKLRTPEWVLRFALARYNSRNKKRKSAAKKVEGERQAIYQSAELLTQFWELLEENNTEVGQVFLMGQKAFEGLELVKKIAKERLDEGTEDLYGAHSLYKQFMQLVFLENIDNERQYQAKTSSSKKVEEKAWMKFSAKFKSMGKISSCNQSFGKLFGYTKSELVGKCVDNLIPRLYKKYIAKAKQYILDAYWKPHKGKVSLSFPMFGIHRNEYVFPIVLGIEKMPSAFKSHDMIVCTYIEKKNFSPRVVYFLTTPELIVDSFSSSAISLFGAAKERWIEGTNLANRILELQQYSWEEVFCNKEGSEATFYLSNELSYRVNCKAGRIEMEKEHVGYWFRIEFETFAELDNNTASVSSSKECDMQFEYNELLNKYILLNKDTKTNPSMFDNTTQVYTPLFGSDHGQDKSMSVGSLDTPKGSRQKLANSYTSYFYIRVLQSISTGPYSSHFKNLREELVERAKLKNYGANVRIYRLIDGEINEIDEQNSCLVEEAFDTNLEGNSPQKRDDYLVADAATIAKKIASREQVIAKMTDSTSKTGARKLAWSVIGSAAMLIFIVTLEYLLTAQSREDAIYRTKIATNTFGFLQNFYLFAFTIERVLYAKEGIYTPYDTAEEVTTNSRRKCEEIIDHLSRVEADYYLDTEVYSKTYKASYPYSYEGLYYEAVYEYNETLNFLLGDMIEIAGNRYHNLSTQTSEVERFRTVVIGGFSDVISAFGYYAIDVLNEYNSLMINRVKIMYIVVSLVVLLATLMIIPFLISSTKEGRYIINQLLHIPKRVILNTKDALTEIMNAASGKVKSEEQESKTHEQYVIEMKRLSKRSPHSGAFSDKLFYVSYYFLPLGILFVMAEGLALGRFLLFNSYTANLDNVLLYYKNAITLSPICLKSLLYQEEFILDKTKTKEGIELFNKSIIYLHEPLNHLADVGEHAFSKNRLERIMEVEKGNLCSLATVKAACNNPDLVDIASQGLDISVAEFTRLLKQQLQIYVKTGSRDAVLQHPDRKLLCNFPLPFTLIVNLLFDVILPAQKVKEGIVLEEMSASYDFKTDSKNLFFACEIITVCVMYACVWLPIILYIRKKIYVTGNILGLVPYPVLISNPKIVHFLEKRLKLLKS